MKVRLWYQLGKLILTVEYIAGTLGAMIALSIILATLLDEKTDWKELSFCIFGFVLAIFAGLDGLRRQRSLHRYPR